MKTCVICGASVQYRNTNTCDTICNAAKKAKRTRAEQMRWEVEHPSDRDMAYAQWLRDDHDVNLGEEP